MGLDRREMSWNWHDDYMYIVNKYHSHSSFVMAAEYGLVPMPVGTNSLLSYTKNSLSLKTSTYFKYSKGLYKGRSYSFSIVPPKTYSKNPWIRFLQMNKGRFKGSDWLTRAREVYYKYYH